jgi:excisionase family DNA binding protein
MGVDELLTTRQLQSLLKVDRITIYRMLNDGRLHGFKVGGQWRFARAEVERWLERQRGGEAPGAAPGGEQTASLASPLPLSCVQAMQSVFAEALGIACVTTDPSGVPMTQISNSCRFCDLVLSSGEGRRRCTDCWSSRAQGRLRTCHAGLSCVGAKVEAEGRELAIFVACQFQPDPVSAETWRQRLPSLVSELGLPETSLVEAAGSIHIATTANLTRLMQKVAGTISQMAQERMGLLGRLQRIAEITTFQA